jgi:23S rRNA (cytidine1920-2'-O)/16S rRNA (cytidine1409-2'-O)-methyltransferase
VTGESPRLVGRGGLKLWHALEHFKIDVTGLITADFGCNVGGFVDALLQRGAAKVYAVDTGYGMLAWTLRQDPQVVVMERTNALHADPPEGGVDLVVIDLGWTPQAKAIPAAARWLGPGGKAVGIVSLIKPHYELLGEEKSLLRSGILDIAVAERIAERTLHALESQGWRILGTVRSPIVGGAGKGHAGNAEWLAWICQR